MRKHLILGALIACSLGVAHVEGGIFNRGGGCPNGTCDGRYSGGYSGGYYATNVVKSPTQMAAQAAPVTVTAPAVAAPTPAPQAPVVTTQTESAPQGANVYSASSSSTRGRFFRRWSR